MDALPGPEYRSEAAERIARLEGLMREHYPVVLRYVRRRAPESNVQDIVASTFAVAWRRIEDVPLDKARPWLLGVARHILIRDARGAGRRHALHLRLAAAYEQRPVAEEPRYPVAEAMAQLSERDQEALLLVYVEDLTTAEAAATLDISAAAFRVRLHRARRRLRLYLEETENATTNQTLETKEETR